MHRPHSRATALLLALPLLVACNVSIEHEGPSAGRTGNLAHRIDDLAEEELDSGAVAGFSLAVWRDGEMVVSRGYGMADLENEVPATADTVYRIGSITKQFTAAAIMKLVEEGRVALDASLAEYVPEFDTQGRTVAIEQLLNHTSGIKSYTGVPAFGERMRLDLSHDELLDMVESEPFDFEPGDGYRYNNTGYYLLGRVIESVTGTPYDEHLRTTLFEPLGLSSTMYCHEGTIIPHRAEGYEYRDGQLVNDDPLSMDLPFAAGALCSSTGDLLRWQDALAHGRVVSEESYARMTTPGTLNDGSPLRYGFGLGIGDLEEHPTVSHGGGINGFNTMLARYPDDDLGVVVLVNTPGRTADRLAERIARVALGLEIVRVADEAISEQQAAPFLGKYELQGPGIVMDIRYHDEAMWAMVEGQGETRLRWQGGDVFAPDFDDEVRITFHVEGDAATGLTLLQGGETEGRRIE